MEFETAFQFLQESDTYPYLSACSAIFHRAFFFGES